MKISDNLRLLQKRNLMVFLSQYAIKINELFFINEIIYNDPSYILATKIAQCIPLHPIATFYNEKRCKQYCEKFIKECEGDYFIILPPQNLCRESYGRVARPNKPIFKISSTNIFMVYQTFFGNTDPDMLLLCSEDFKKGLFVNAYSDDPTEENGMSDENLFECFEWNDM